MQTVGDLGAVVAVGDVVRWERVGLVEEYRDGPDGIRQDFVVERQPQDVGFGELRLELEVRGAQVGSGQGEPELVVEGSGRRLSYGKLRVTDATGRQLESRFEPVASDRLAVVVRDAGAVYPVRIDPTYSDGNWRSMGRLSGIDGEVGAAEIDENGNLYIRGGFRYIGDLEVNGIAKWDGNRWSAMGAGLVTFGSNYDLAVHRDEVYATAGSQVVRWDGNSWSALGSARANGSFIALGIMGAHLYAAGQFSSIGGALINNIARWTGSEWAPLGTGTDGRILTLATAGNRLYAGGTFTTAGGASVASIAQWNEGEWSALGSGLSRNFYQGPAPVNTLVTDGDVLYAGGYFNLAGNQDVNHIAKWNGSRWMALGGGVDGPVSALMVIGNSVYVGGNFRSAGGLIGQNLSRWNGSEWSVDGLGTDGQVLTMAEAGGSLYFGGSFLKAGDRVVNHLGALRNGNWSSVGQSVSPNPGLNAPVNALVVSGSDIYAGGYFTASGEQELNHIARWDGNRWNALGTGVNGRVDAMLKVESYLYAAGHFSTAGGGGANNIAKWNGTSWSAPGAGVNGPVTSMAEWNGDIYVGGSFTQAGAAIARRIARYNGVGWSSVDDSSEELAQAGPVNAIAVNGTGLYAAGQFRSAVDSNRYAFRVAHWNGNAWSFLGRDFDAPIDELVASGSSVFVAGSFRNAGGWEAMQIARWHGSRWMPVGDSIRGNQKALALSTSGSYVYAQGILDGVFRVVRWNGSEWSAIGRGVNGTAHALTVSGSAIYLGGDFSEMGNGEPSAFVAKLLGSELNVEDSTYSRARGLPLKIRITDLASDASGESVILDSLGPSLYGATLTHDDTYIFYQPNRDFGVDAFTYTVNSGTAKASGTVTIQLAAGEGGIARSIDVKGGVVRVRFFGLPGVSYDVQRTSSLVNPVAWTTVSRSAFVPEGDGSFVFEDSSPPSGSAYYRCIMHGTIGSLP